MDLKLENKNFIICGATSGFGLSTLKSLVNEKAKIIAIARDKEKLDELKKLYPHNVSILPGDITKPETLTRLLDEVRDEKITGILVNAGGPPAKKFEETTLDDWDSAYSQLVRWKVDLTQRLLPKFIEQGFGKFLFIESASVKQPIENLVLSTSLRLAVVGFVKSITQEIPQSGVQLNILAPGYHKTAAVDRLLYKKAEQLDSDYNNMLVRLEESLPMKKLGNPDDFGKLATWLFSPYASYINGQVIPVDGGFIQATLG